MLGDLPDDTHENDLCAAMDWLLPRQVRIDEELRDVEGLDWITALRSSAILKLADQGLVEPSLFDQTNLGQIHSPSQNKNQAHP